MNEFCFWGDKFKHIDRNGRNNRIESDHVSLKRIIDPGRGFQSLRTAKATLKGVEVHRMIKRGHPHGSREGVTVEIDITDSLFNIASYEKRAIGALLTNLR